MSDPIAVGRKKPIRDCGYDERWLEDQIAGKPAILGLGEDLRVVYRQREQSSGGRLDLLLEDAESDERPMYEVELMLGKTDESHIIRTIEYWDNEKRKWPKRSHTAVLVAEFITNRFFNVIRLLGHAIPIIAIQADVIEADGKCVLHFSKVLDTYTEPETESSETVADEAHWNQYAPETLKMAKRLQELLASEGGPFTLHITKSYIGLDVGEAEWVWLHARAKGRSRLNFWVTEPFLSKAESCAEAAGLDYKRRENYHDGTALYFTLGMDEISRNTECLKQLCQLGEESTTQVPSTSAKE